MCKLRNALLQFSALALIGSCLSPLDRFAEYQGGQLVVSGQISTIAEANVVYVGRTSNRERFPEPVSEASVMLLDNLGNTVSFFSDADVAGKYILPDFAGEPGVAYFIRITLPGGQTYESKPETIPVAKGTDEVYYTIEPEEYIDGDGIIAERDFIKIYTNHTTPETEDPFFIRWHVDEVYILSPTDFPDPWGNVPPACFISQQVDPQRVVLFDGETVRTPFIPDLLITSRLVDRTFKERHYFTVYQSSLTREAYEYWKKVDVVANQTGSIFDAPPARLKGNISNTAFSPQEVHGYFQAVNQSFERFYLLPEDLPYDFPLHCEYRDYRNYYDYPTECLDCGSVRNSSHIRPEWF